MAKQTWKSMYFQMFVLFLAIGKIDYSPSGVYMSTCMYSRKTPRVCCPIICGLFYADRCLAIPLKALPVNGFEKIKISNNSKHILDDVYYCLIKMWTTMYDYEALIPVNKVCIFIFSNPYVFSNSSLQIRTFSVSKDFYKLCRSWFITDLYIIIYHTRYELFTIMRPVWRP